MHQISVSQLLSYIKLDSYQHVCVKRFREHIGGGFSLDVSRRFGDMIVEHCCIVDNILVLYVLEV